MQGRLETPASGSGRPRAADFPRRRGVHTVAAMANFRTPALLGALVLTASAGAAPRIRTAPRLTLQLHARLGALVRHDVPEAVHHALRALPTPLERPGAYEVVSRWIEQVAVPGPDGRPKVVVVSVRGGFGLGWARRW